MNSLLIDGLINENKESLAYQLVVWHNLTLLKIIHKKIHGWISNEDKLQTFINKNMPPLLKMESAELTIWKFNELIRYLKLDIPEKMTSQNLYMYGTTIESQAVRLLKKSDSNFKGNTTDEMIRYLLNKILQNSYTHYKQQNHETQEKIVREILATLEEMPFEQKECLKGLLGVKDFSFEMIHTAIQDQSLGSALGSLMDMVRYTIYYEVAKVGFILSGMATIAYGLPLKSLLLSIFLILFNPFSTAAMAIGLTWWTDYFTNRKIRSFLFPIMVMNSIIVSEIKQPQLHQTALQHLADLYNERQGKINLRGIGGVLDAT